jgi:hypothetical protein
MIAFGVVPICRDPRARQALLLVAAACWRRDGPIRSGASSVRSVGQRLASRPISVVVRQASAACIPTLNHTHRGREVPFQNGCCDIGDALPTGASVAVFGSRESVCMAAGTLRPEKAGNAMRGENGGAWAGAGPHGS